jgi:hypothetical protein
MGEFHLLAILWRERESGRWREIVPSTLPAGDDA